MAKLLNPFRTPKPLSILFPSDLSPKQVSSCRGVNILKSSECHSLLFYNMSFFFPSSKSWVCSSCIKHFHGTLNNKSVFGLRYTWYIGMKKKALEAKSLYNKKMHQSYRFLLGITRKKASRSARAPHYYK